MLTLPRPNLLAGLVCILLGGFVAWRGYGYSIGTLDNIGPGLFPAILGAVLLLCGVGLCIQAIREGDDRRVEIALRSYLAIPGAIVLFALTIDRFGVLPSVVVATVVASFASSENSWRSTAVVACLLMALVYTVFIAVLGIPLEPYMWRP